MKKEVGGVDTLVRTISRRSTGMPVCSLVHSYIYSYTHLIAHIGHSSSTGASNQKSQTIPVSKMQPMQLGSVRRT